MSTTANPTGLDIQSATETSAAKTSDLSAEIWRSTGTLLQSAAYTGIAEPILGVTQIIDKVAGTQIMGSASNVLAYAGISEPRQAVGRTESHAQMLGNAVGMMLPYLMLHKAVRTEAALAFGEESVAVRGNLAAMESGTFGRVAAKEAALGFATGTLYDGVFRPSSGNVNGFNFAGDRLLNGITGGVTMATLTGSSIGLARIGAGELVKGTMLKTALSNPIGTGVISAVPSGIVSAEAQALRQGRLFPTAAETGDSIYQMAFVGGALGAAHRFELGGRNDLKYEDASTVLRTGKIESMETPMQKAERLGLVKKGMTGDMERSKDLVFGKIRAKDGIVLDVVIRPFNETVNSLMRLARADVTNGVNETIRSMTGVSSSALPLVLRDKVALPLTDCDYNVTLREPAPVMVQENGGKQLGTQIREWANQSVGLNNTAEMPVGSLTRLIGENADVRSLVGRAAFDNLYKGNVDLIEFSQQTVPEGTAGVDLKPSQSLRLVSIDNKNDFSLVETPTWGFGSQFGLSLEVAKALEGKRLSDASPKLQSNAEAMLKVFSSESGKRRLRQNGLSSQEIDAAALRLASLVQEGFPMHLGVMHFFADDANTQITASLNNDYDLEGEAVRDYLKARDKNLVLVKDGGPLRMERRN